MKKQVFMMLLSALLCFALTACGGTGDVTADHGVDETANLAEDHAAEEVERPLKIAVLMSHQSNEFTKAVAAAAVAKGEELGVEVEVFDGNKDQAIQNSQIEQCLNLEFDGILVEPITVDGASAAVKESCEQGVPVMTIVQKMAEQELAIAFRGGDDASASRMQMEKVAELLGGKGSIVVLYGPEGSEGQMIRKQGYDEVLAGYPEIEVVFEETANWSTEEAAALVTTWLSTGTEIDAVVAQNDGMAMGALRAVEAAGAQDDIVIVGIDADEEALAAIQEGHMAGTVSQDAALQGTLGMEAMVQYLNGQIVDSVVYTNPIWIDASNVHEYYSAENSIE